MALQHAALLDTVCLEARGAEAAAFLHAQLSRAVAELDIGAAPLAGWADPRGRVRALLRVCRLPDRWLLLAPRDGADEFLKKLRTFVLRSKVTLAPAADVHVAALLGEDDAWFAAQGVSAADTPLNRLVSRDDVTFVRVGPSYWQALGTPAALVALTAGLDNASATDAAHAEIKL